MILIKKKNSLNRKPFEYEIIKFIEIIGKHDNFHYKEEKFIKKYHKNNKLNYSADLIKEIKYTYFISKGENSFIIYNKIFEIMKEVFFPKNILYNIFEINSYSILNNEIHFIICSQKKIYLMKLNLENITLTYENYSIPISASACFNIGDNKFIIIGENGVFIDYNFFGKNEKEINKRKCILEEPYIGGLKINKNLLAFTSNRLIPDGKDKIIFYDINLEKIINEIEGYSFIISNNGIISIETLEKNNILLCACKKYLSFQKSGILLIFIENKDKIIFKHKLYKIKNYEVNCFCQIMLNNNEPTNYFFIGGFNPIKGEGLIKLYKLNINKNFEDIFIEYIQDIIINKNYLDFKGFQSSISCITQSSIGNIIITCWDGNVYLFSPPNIDYYLKYNNNIIIELLENKNENEKPGKDEYIENNESISKFLNSANENNFDNFNNELKELQKIDSFYIFSEINNNLFEDNEIIIEQILDKSIFEFYTNKKGKNPFLIFKDIIYGDNYSLSYNIFKDLKKNKSNFKNYEEEILFENYLKLIEILEEIEEKIKKKYKNNYNLKLKICFNSVKEKEFSIPFYYTINCNYIFHIPNENYIRIYQSKDILDKGLGNEFYYMLNDINDISYKDIEYNNIYEFQNTISLSNNNDFNSNNSNSIKRNISGILSSNSNENISSIRAIISSLKSYSEKYECFFLFNEILQKKSSEDAILEILLIIEKNNGIIFIKELNNGFWIGLGEDNKIFLYDIFYNKIMEVKIPNEYSDFSFFDIYETNINEKKENNIISLDLMLCRNINHFYYIILNIDIQNTSIEKKDKEHNSLLSNSLIDSDCSFTNYYFLKLHQILLNFNKYLDFIKKKTDKAFELIEFIITFIETFELLTELFNNNKKLIRKEIFSCYYYIKDLINFKDEIYLLFFGLTINKFIDFLRNLIKKKMQINIILLNKINYFLKKEIYLRKNNIFKKNNSASIKINENLSFGFYNDNIIIESNRIIYLLNNYIINNNIKGYFTLIPKKSRLKGNSKLLFIVKDNLEKIGILIVDILFENKKIQHNFYEIKNFEITCICPIVIKTKTELKETEYILVGGFDKKESEGVIKLYKINLKNEPNIKIIQYIKDILFKEKFENPINYITQSEKTGNIIICFLDGKTYLLTQPNIDYYLRKDGFKI